MSVKNLVLYFIAYAVLVCLILIYYGSSDREHWLVPVLIYQCVFFVYHFLTDKSDVDGRRTQKNS